MVELTEREREVAELVAEGLTYRQIGERLGISPRTVEAHVRHTARKLGNTGLTPKGTVYSHQLSEAEPTVR